MLIGKLDRLSRSVAFIEVEMESGVAFNVVGSLFMEKFKLHILAAVVKNEKISVSIRHWRW